LQHEIDDGRKTLKSPQPGFCRARGEKHLKLKGNIQVQERQGLWKHRKDAEIKE